MLRQVRQQFPRQIVEIEIPEVRALRRPDETLAVLEKARRGPARPASQPGLAHHAAALARRRRAGRDIIMLLQPVGPAHEDFRTVLRPLRRPHIVPDHVVRERRAMAHVHRHGCASRHVVHHQVGHGILRAWMRIGLHQHGRLRLGLVELQEVVVDLSLVIAHPRQLAAVGRPPHRLRDAELFQINVRSDAMPDA